MAEWQIGHQKSRLVLSMRFPILNWRFCSVAKSAYSNMTPRFSGLFSMIIWFGFLCAQVSSRNYKTIEDSSTSYDNLAC